MIEGVLDWLDDATVPERIRRFIRVETPVYANFADPDEERRWAAGIDEALSTFIRCARENRGLTEEERAVMRVIGRRRAEQASITVDALDASIGAAVCTALDYVMERASRIGFEDAERMSALRELSMRLMRFRADVTAAAITGFLERKEELAATRARADARLFDDILGGGYDVSEVVARGASQGIDLKQPWAGVLVPPGGPVDVGLHDAAARLVSALPRAIPISMATAAVPHEVVIFQAGLGSDWARACRALVALADAAGRTLLSLGPCTGPDELRRRYVDARAVLAYVPSFAEGDLVLDVRELPELALLTAVGDDAKHAYLRDVLGPLEDLPAAKRDRIFRTMESVTKHGHGPKMVAQETGFDRKTVTKHIAQVEGLTGLCLDRVDHVRRLGLGLQLRKVVRGHPASS